MTILLALRSTRVAPAWSALSGASFDVLSCARRLVVTGTDHRSQIEAAVHSAAST
jgi:hypothetical protein